MKTYGEIDLDETPILVLGCGHFFTAETLDGHVGISEVYEQDGYGNFKGVSDISAGFARSIPRCPDCQCPVRQHCAKRFNRAVNRAVIDEMSKRFLVNGQADLRDLERQVVEMEVDLNDSRAEIVKVLRQASDNSDTGQITPVSALNLRLFLVKRQTRATMLERMIRNFLNRIADKQQPVQKLHDATINAMRRRSAEEKMADLSITNSIPPVARDRRIILGGRAVQLQAESIIVEDSLLVVQALKPTTTNTLIKIPAPAPEQKAKTFFQSCKGFIDECNSENLPKLAVEASLFYASTARTYKSYCHANNKTNDMQHASQQVTLAKDVLDRAKGQCRLGFQNADALPKAVENSLKLLGREWYEEVSAEEIFAVKKAMLDAANFATHAGHWYNCTNGHPVSRSTQDFVRSLSASGLFFLSRILCEALL